MAIIYTYPRLNNPTGQELIVVSDVNNQNATRLITIADLCSCCGSGSGSGCTDVFKTVKAGGVLSTASGCNDEIEFTSSGGTVTITTPIDGVVNFEAASGGGECPITYVLKPVSCNLGLCTTNEIATNWAFTCSPAFAPHVGSYVYLTNDGVVVYNTGPSHGGSPGDTCWEVQLWDPVPTAMTCEECCDGPTETVRFDSCDGAYTIYNDTISTGTLVVDENVNLDVPGYPGENCWQYKGPQAGAAEAATLNGEYNRTDCECCESDVRRYTPCDGGDDVDIDITEHPLLNQYEPDDCIQIKMLVTDQWKCYTFVSCPDPGTATVNPHSVTVSAYTPCCETPECNEVFDYVPCPGNPAGYTTTLVADGLPVAPAAEVGDVIRVDTGTSDRACYTILLNPLSVPADPIPVALEVYEDPDNTCECCENTIKTYADCETGATYYLDLEPDGLATQPPPPCIVITNDTTGIASCATYVDCTQGPALGGVTLSTPAGADCCDPIAPECDQELVDWRFCDANWDTGGGESGYDLASNLPVLGVLQINVAGAGEDGYTYTYVDAFGVAQCIVIRERNGYTPEPASYAALPTVTVNYQITYEGEEGTTDCECCEGTYKYERCPEPYCSGAQPNLPIVIYFDKQRFASPLAPSTMLEVEHIASGDKCCYIKQEPSECRRSNPSLGLSDDILWPFPEDYNPATHNYLETGDADCATCLD